MSLSFEPEPLAPHPSGRGAAALRGALESLFKDWRVVVATMAVVLAAAGATAVLVKPSFTASASLLVPLSTDYAARGTAGAETGAASPAMLEKDAILKSEVEILTSPSLARAAVEEVGLTRLFPTIGRPGLRARLTDALHEALAAAARPFGLTLARRVPPDPLDLGARAFEKALTVTPDKIGALITVSFRNPDPAAAADAVNRLVALYLQKRATLFSDVQSPAVAVEAKALAARADEAARALADFKAKNNVADHALQRDLLLRQRADILRDRQLAEADAAQAGKRVEVLAHELNETPGDLVTTGAGGQQLVRHGRPNVVDAQEIDRSRARQSLEAAKARVAADDVQLAEADATIRDLEGKAFELARLERERDLAGDHYAAVAKTLDARRFQEDVSARRAASVRVIDPATPPLDAGNQRLVIFAAGVLLSLFAGALAAVLADVFRRGFISPDKLERALGLPVLAVVPVLERVPDASGLKASRLEAL